MGLKFYPRPGHLVTFASGHAIGQLSRFVGRTLATSDRKGVAGAYAADAEPVEVPTDGPDAAHLIRQTQKGGLWAADAATAAACGVEFVALEKDADGEWMPAPKSAPAPEKPKPKAEV
jgi:hypothetical protein